MQLNIDTLTQTPTLDYELMETPPASALAGHPVYVAKIVHRKPINLMTLAQKLARTTPYRVDDIIHVLSSLADLMQSELAQGHSINFGGLFHMTPTIHGTFDAPDAAFDPSRQRVVVKACTGKLLRDAASQIKTRDVTPTPTVTPPEEVPEKPSRSLPRPPLPAALPPVLTPLTPPQKKSDKPLLQFVAPG